MEKNITKIYDCSNQVVSTHHYNSGPIENDIIGYLKHYAFLYNCEFIYNHKEADVVITNDVFPTYILKSNKRLVKRMDGIFFQEYFQNRNIPLNNAGYKADHVIFISNFSKNSFPDLHNLKSYSVALNQADPNIFKPIKKSDNGLKFISIASSWERPEKRFSDILQFANMITETILLIGKIPDIKLPKNIISFGYQVDPETINYIINQTSAFVNFSYRDAAPKTVLQGLCCGLPVLYANSGGLKELVEDYGIGIKDSEYDQLSNFEILRGYNKFKEQFPKLQKDVSKRNNQKKFKQMLDGYFKEIIKQVKL